jgi:hypothetical protein
LGNGGGFKYFFGVTDSDGPFDAITISSPGMPAVGFSGFFGVDNLRFVSATAVPEPGSLACLSVIGVAAAFRWRKRRAMVMDRSAAPTF